MAESNRVGVQFLFTELDTAATFLDLAEATQSDSRRAQDCEIAQMAYKTVLRYLPRVLLSQGEQLILNSKLSDLKKRLTDIGWNIDACGKVGSAPPGNGI